MNWFKHLLSRINRPTPYNQLHPEQVRDALVKNPWARKQIIKFSLDEYEINPYYASVINNLGLHTLGASPNLIRISKNKQFNDAVEDEYCNWVSDNSDGFAFRKMREMAALTGLGVGIPFKKTYTLNPVELSYKVFGTHNLKTPVDADPSDRIIDGIQYDSNWEPERFFLVDQDKEYLHVPYTANDTKEYTVEECVYWSRGYSDGRMSPVPECVAAFQTYPFIRRFLQAVIEGEEMKASHPMALEVDATVYSVANKRDPPKGQFNYEPRTIKTLPPGTKLTGMPPGMSGTEQTRLIRLFASACALTVNMPANIALADSADSNMSSAQVDIQPWANKIAVDRFDLEPTIRRVFREWYSLALLRDGVFNQASMLRRTFPQTFPHTYVYVDIHSHPDPTKRANARAIDLKSGATTLAHIYSQLGLNGRRQLEKGAELLGLSVEDYQQLLISNWGNIHDNSAQSSREDEDEGSRVRGRT